CSFRRRVGFAKAVSFLVRAISVPPHFANTGPQTYLSSRAVCETGRRGSAWQGPAPRPGSGSPISGRGWQRSSRSTIPICAFVLGPFVLCFFVLCSFALCPRVPCNCLQSSAPLLSPHLIADDPWSPCCPHRRLRRLFGPANRQQRQGMARDHEFLIGRNDVETDATISCGDRRGGCRIGLGIERA